jgi:hypothetical protein
MDMDFYVAYVTDSREQLRGVIPVENYPNRDELVMVCPEGDSISTNFVSLTPDSEGFVDLTTITISESGEASVS